MIQISAFQSLHSAINKRTHLDSLNPGLRGAEVAARGTSEAFDFQPDRWKPDFGHVYF
jgi:hypothetical protein